MNQINDLATRWSTPAGRELAAEAWRHLSGEARRLPREIGKVNGRRDLRWLPAPATAVHTLSGVRWTALDLSYSNISSVRLSSSQVANCRFEGATLVDWRIFSSEISQTSFAGASLPHLAIGIRTGGEESVLSHVNLQESDLRSSVASGARFKYCRFDHARLDGAQFLRCGWLECAFLGSINDVLFDGRDFAGEPQSDVFRRVDFSEAVFQGVDFRGCRFDSVLLPAGVQAIPKYPEVAGRARDLLHGDESIEARMLRADLEMSIMSPGSADSVGVFNPRDYRVAGGDGLLTLARRVLVDQ